jgi:hypothetical protein
MELPRVANGSLLNAPAGRRVSLTEFVAEL